MPADVRRVLTNDSTVFLPPAVFTIRTLKFSPFFSLAFSQPVDRIHLVKHDDCDRWTPVKTVTLGISGVPLAGENSRRLGLFPTTGTLYPVPARKTGPLNQEGSAMLYVVISGAVVLWSGSDYLCAVALAKCFPGAVVAVVLRPVS